jgi:hypothetical protein
MAVSGTIGNGQEFALQQRTGQSLSAEFLLWKSCWDVFCLTIAPDPGVFNQLPYSVPQR